MESRPPPTPPLDLSDLPFYTAIPVLPDYSDCRRLRFSVTTDTDQQVTIIAVLAKCKILVQQRPY